MIVKHVDVMFQLFIIFKGILWYYIIKLCMGQAGTQLLWVNKAARTAGSPMQLIISEKRGTDCARAKFKGQLTTIRGKKGAGA